MNSERFVFASRTMVRSASSWAVGLRVYELDGRVFLSTTGGFWDAWPCPFVAPGSVEVGTLLVLCGIVSLRVSVGGFFEATLELVGSAAWADDMKRDGMDRSCSVLRRWLMM